MPSARGRDYPVVLTERNGRFHLFVRELGLRVADPSLGAAYARLAEERQRCLAELEETGLEDLLPPAAPRHDPHGLSDRRSGLGRFAGKAAIVAGALIVVMLFAGWTVNAVVDSAVARLGMNQVGGREFWTGLEAAIHEAGAPDQDMPPEQRERLLESMAVIVERVRPFTETLQPLFPPRECVIRIEDARGSIANP